MEVEQETSQKKVIHFAHWGGSGITTLIKLICRSRRHSFLLLKSESEFESKYVDVVNKRQLKFGRDNIFSALFSLLGFFREVRPDVIHCHSFTPFVMSSLLYWKCPIIFQLHNEYPYLFENDFRSTVKRSAIKSVALLRNVTFLAVSQKTADRVEEMTGSECQLIINGVSDKGGVRARFSEELSSFRFFSVCRLEKSKNLCYAIDLVLSLSNNFGRGAVSFHIFGDGPDKDSIVSYAKKFDTKGVVQFRGYVNEPEHYYQDFDYYLSTSFFEGFGLSIVSALRAGNIVFLTKTGELVHHLENGYHGFYLTGSLDFDVATIRDVANLSVTKLDQIQKNGRDIFERKFKIESMLESLDLVYSEVC